MKKAIIAIILLTTAVAVAWLAFDSVFPRAEPLRLPNSIKSVTLSRGELSIELIPSEASDLLELIENVEPTRRMSVNDTPPTSDYVYIELFSDEKYQRLYVYFDDGRQLLELPYEGVYLTDSRLMSLIDELV